MKKNKSALACCHANEVPLVCKCDADCYCKKHTCRPSKRSKSDRKKHLVRVKVYFKCAKNVSVEVDLELKHKIRSTYESEQLLFQIKEAAMEQIGIKIKQPQSKVWEDVVWQESDA